METEKIKWKKSTHRVPIGKRETRYCAAAYLITYSPLHKQARLSIQRWDDRLQARQWAYFADYKTTKEAKKVAQLINEITLFGKATDSPKIYWQKYTHRYLGKNDKSCASYNYEAPNFLIVSLPERKMINLQVVERKSKSSYPYSKIGNYGSVREAKIKAQIIQNHINTINGERK